MSRKTIKDIAHEAGVSITAVSFALNNRPGISDATRERILAIANRMDWVPNSRAQSLSLAKADAVGLFIARQPDSYTTGTILLQLHHRPPRNTHHTQL